MVLPPELIYEIIFHLRHDKQALLKCSLVTNLWAYSSQKLLHDWHLHFTPETFQAWKETAPSTSIEPLQHVCSLTCSGFDPLDDFHGDHLKSFHRLQHITLHLITSTRPDLANSLLASQNTLSSLLLRNVFFFDTAVVNLINHFPNLRELDIDQSMIHNDRENVPSSSISPRGLLHLTDLRAGSLVSLFTCLSGLELEYDELEMVGPTSSQPCLYVPPIVYACGKALVCLKLSPHFCEPQRHASRTHPVAPFNTTIFQCPPISLSRIAQDYASSYSSPIQHVCNRQHSPS